MTSGVTGFPLVPFKRFHDTGSQIFLIQRTLMGFLNTDILSCLTLESANNSLQVKLLQARSIIITTLNVR
jgi:hypothetical protein